MSQELPVREDEPHDNQNDSQNKDDLAAVLEAVAQR